MACDLFDAKPLSEPMLNVNLVRRNRLEWNSNQNTKCFFHENLFDYSVVIYKRCTCYAYQIHWFVKCDYYASYYDIPYFTIQNGHSIGHVAWLTLFRLFSWRSLITVEPRLLFEDRSADWVIYPFWDMGRTKNIAIAWHDTWNLECQNHVRRFQECSDEILVYIVFLWNAQQIEPAILVCSYSTNLIV